MARKFVEKRFMLKLNAKVLSRIKKAAYDAGRIELGYLTISNKMTVALCKQKLGDWWRHSQLLIEGDKVMRITLDPEQFVPMWQLTEGRRLQKDCYCLPLISGEMLEIAVYKGQLRGRALATVQLSKKTAPTLHLPDILGVLCNVSGLKQYREEWLVLHGWPED